MKSGISCHDIQHVSYFQLAAGESIHEIEALCKPFYLQCDIFQSGCGYSVRKNVDETRYYPLGIDCIMKRGGWRRVIEIIKGLYDVRRKGHLVIVLMKNCISTFSFGITCADEPLRLETRTNNLMLT